MFKSGQTSGDYHKDMNFDNYERWLRTQLIPNLKPNSVLIIDNASYHNVVENPAPSSNSRKAEMRQWLEERDIITPPNLLKAELYQIVLQNKEKYKTYKIDRILGEHGHECLRLPPYHPELNAIEKIWAVLKGYVSRKNVNLNGEAVKQLIIEKVSTISQEWKDVCRHVKGIEKDMMDKEVAHDNYFDDSSFVFNVSESSSDSDSEYSD
jgi:transposase